MPVDIARNIFPISSELHLNKVILDKRIEDQLAAAEVDAPVDHSPLMASLHMPLNIIGIVADPDAVGAEPSPYIRRAEAKGAVEFRPDCPWNDPYSRVFMKINGAPLLG